MIKEIKTENCIVGSGFCGYAAYTKMIRERKDLLLIEGGNLQTPKNQEEQKHYKVRTNKYVGELGGKKVINKMDPSFSERKFTLGGSSECWGGWIRPFEISTYQNSFEQFSDQTWPNFNLSKYDQES